MPKREYGKKLCAAGDTDENGIDRKGDTLKMEGEPNMKKVLPMNLQLFAEPAGSGAEPPEMCMRDSTGTAEKNIINKDLGIIDDFGILAQYNGNGTKDDKIPHILFQTSGGDKVVYVMGYGDKKKWQKALGGQYGCLYIDEINTADIDFVREASMRCDYLMATLNPDDPNLDIYKEYINCSRPLPEWEAETPQEIKDELREEPKPGWVHWFFSFAHNLGLAQEKLNQIVTNTPKGCLLYTSRCV